MRTSTKSMARGLFHEFRGTVKQMVGSLLSRRTLGARGKVERIAGKFQWKIGKVQGMCGF